MRLNRSLLILLGILFVIGSVFFDYKQKRDFNQNISQLQSEQKEIESVAKLQKMWLAKGMIKKINKIANSVSASKKVNSTVKRSKAKLKFKNLTYSELNRVLSKLASLPVRFNYLNIQKEKNNYLMECSCVW